MATLENSPNAILNKSVADRYRNLQQPDDKIKATYIWIDGTGENLRAKTRTVDATPQKPEGWFF